MSAQMTLYQSFLNGFIEAIKLGCAAVIVLAWFGIGVGLFMGIAGALSP